MPLLEISILDTINALRTLDYQYDGAELSNWRPRFMNGILDKGGTDLNNKIYLAEQTNPLDENSEDGNYSNNATNGDSDLDLEKRDANLSGPSVHTENPDNYSDFPTTDEYLDNPGEADVSSNSSDSESLPQVTEATEDLPQVTEATEDLPQVPVATEQDQEQMSSDSNDSYPSEPELSWGSDSDERPNQPVRDHPVNSSDDADNELNSYDSDPENVERDASVPDSQRGLDSDDVQDALDEHVGLSNDFVEDVQPHQQNTRNAAKIAADILDSNIVNAQGESVIDPEVVEHLRQNMQTTENISNRFRLGVEHAENIIQQTEPRGLMTPERGSIQTWSSNQQNRLQIAERLANDSVAVLDNVLSGNPNGAPSPSDPVVGNAAVTAWLDQTSGTYVPNSSDLRPTHLPTDHIPKTEGSEPKS